MCGNLGKVPASRLWLVEFLLQTWAIGVVLPFLLGSLKGQTLVWPRVLVWKFREALPVDWVLPHCSCGCSGTEQVASMLLTFFGRCHPPANGFCCSWKRVNFLSDKGVSLAEGTGASLPSSPRSPLALRSVQLTPAA